MNPFANEIGGEEAQIVYGDGDFDVVRPGTYVKCAVTGKRIPLEGLKYWSVDHQEAYIDGETSVQRYKQLAGLAK